MDRVALEIGVASGSSCFASVRSLGMYSLGIDGCWIYGCRIYWRSRSRRGSIESNAVAMEAVRSAIE